MSNDNLRRIVEARHGSMSNEEFEFGISMIEKVKQHNEKIGIKHTDYGLIRLADDCMKKVRKEMAH